MHLQKMHICNIHFINTTYFVQSENSTMTQNDVIYRYCNPMVIKFQNLIEEQFRFRLPSNNFAPCDFTSILKTMMRNQLFVYENTKDIY